MHYAVAGRQRWKVKKRKILQHQQVFHQAFAEKRQQAHARLRDGSVDQRQHSASNQRLHQAPTQRPVITSPFSFHQKDCIHSGLFLRVLNSESTCGSLEDVSSIDKELKWEILKMPTSPFLPSPNPAHKHYLILDLDETLIHFNPNKDAFHVRPFASEFL